MAALQMVSGVRLEGNLKAAYSLMTEAAQAGAELVALPEYFCLLGANDTDKLTIQERLGQGPIQKFLSEAARELGVWVVAGTLPISASTSSMDLPNAASGSHVFNSTLVYNPQGACVSRYDKIHLFRFDNGSERYDEARVLLAGSQPVSFSLPSKDGHCWQVGLSICYDLRFPELYRAYVDRGVDLILVPSAFTYTTGQAHWELLLRARAVESLAYLMAPAQGGQHENGRRTWGHSQLVDPWGRVLDQREEGAGIVMADFEADLVASCRKQLPALTHRVL